MLVSIHADSSPRGDSLKGASVWVLSNSRASDEMGKWLEDHEKQSELLGGAGSVLSSNNERYLNQTVLDLQFSHSQRAGYELGKSILAKMSNVAALAKSSPQHASLSVLRSPDIPSVLVETGFLSNSTEEAKLASANYRKQVARAIYNGLVAYRAKNAVASSSVSKKSDKEDKQNKKEEKTAKADLTKKPASEKQEKNTQSDKTKLKEKSKKEDKKEDSAKTNKKKEQQLKEKTALEKDQKNQSKKSDSQREIKVSNSGYHIVQQDETVYSIARAYGTTPQKISELNNLKNYQITVGKKLKVK